MIKYAVASCLLALVLGWTLSYNDDTCPCNQYYTEEECIYEFCTWNDTTTICQEETCYGKSKGNCNENKDYCFWNSTSCNPFSDCESLSGNSTDACHSQNHYCTWSSGSSCILNQCSLYNTTNCPNLCYNNGQKCEQYTSCSQFPKCPDDQTCTLSNGSCVPSTCSMMSNLQCDNVQTISDVDGSFSFTPCFWNGTVCQDASPSDLNTTELCAYNTYGFYHWSSANLTDGSCIACYGILAQALIFAMILLA